MSVVARSWAGARRRLSRGDRVVLAVFAGGIALRVAFVVLYRPAFLGIPDSGSYMFAAHYGLFDNVYDPAGYPLFLRLLHAVYPHLTLLIVVQHALGVGTAALLYLLVRRAGGSALLGLVPSVVVLFDGYGLWVEHTPLTETLFIFLIVSAVFVGVLAAEDGRLRVAAAAGALIGVAGLIRPIGFVLLVVLGLWLLACLRGGARRRIATVAVLLAPACALLGTYVIVQRAEIGFTGLTQDSGRILYARVAGFADCRQFTPPAGTRRLCQTTPPARRGSFNQYLTGYPDHATGVVTNADRSISPAWRVFGPPPAGDARLRAFGMTAIIHQPLDYISAVANDFHYYWTDDHRAFIAAAARVDPGIDQIVAGYYRTGAGVASTGLGFLRWYGEHVEISGPLMLVLLLAALTAPLAVDRRTRRVAVLLACTGWVLPLAADAVASVDPRFMLPAYGPLAGAAAIGVRGIEARLRLARRFGRPRARTASPA